MAKRTPTRDGLARRGLTKQRDESVAGRIDESLDNGEARILFIHAYHSVVSCLDQYIGVTQVKGVARVREYRRALIEREFDQLLRRPSECLVSAVSDS